MIWKSLRRDVGQGLVEYVLILIVVVIIVISALTSFGGTTSNLVNDISESMP